MYFNDENVKKISKNDGVWVKVSEMGWLLGWMDRKSSWWMWGRREGSRVLEEADTLSQPSWPLYQSKVSLFLFFFCLFSRRESVYSNLHPTIINKFLSLDKSLHLSHMVFRIDTVQQLFKGFLYLSTNFFLLIYHIKHTYVRGSLS